MPVLVAYASKHGATRQIAERIGEVLRASGLDAEVRPVRSAGDPAGYDAVVLGSAVYFGAWRREGTAYVRRHRGALSGRPVTRLVVRGNGSAPPAAEAMSSWRRARSPAATASPSPAGSCSASPPSSS